MELETLIREVLREHAADAPTSPPRLPEPRPRRWLYAGLAAALVAALAVTSAMLRRDRASSPADSLAPPGYKPVSYHGITIAVPESLQPTSSLCGQPGVVAVDPQVTYRQLCPVAGTPTILLSPLPGKPSPRLRSSYTDFEIDGHPAARSIADRWLELPDSGVLIELDRVSASTSRTVLDSVQVTPVDLPRLRRARACSPLGLAAGSAGARQAGISRAVPLLDEHSTATRPVAHRLGSARQ